MCERFFLLHGSGKENELIYTVRGSGFLHHMVRNLVGTFMLVGKGTLQASRTLRGFSRRTTVQQRGRPRPPADYFW